MDMHSEYSSAFLYAITHLMEIEGGYVNDPYDPGGETNFGISKRAHPNLDIANLTLDQAIFLYWKKYWLDAKCDQIPDPFAQFLFDCRVNHQPYTANRLLQLGLGVKADGVIGPVTLAAAHNADVEICLARMFAHRAELYHNLVVSNSTSAKFLNGWYYRLFSLQQHIFKDLLTGV